MPNAISIELLAPARDLACGMAAIDHGADAVYIGPPAFGARAAAGNSIEDIAALCRYAHQYSARVYATVNTLLHDDELTQAYALLQQLGEAGVDAVLIQDMRLVGHCPVPLHASTQADNRTADHVRRLYDMGIRRAVLARELTIDEVRAIHEAVPEMELEVFVHGALCVSYSGRCYASEYCFGRSANRGECAQFCRMPFDLVDASGHELEHQRHLLSLRDLSQAANIGALIEAGAVSLKIEGRLKDMAYVKNVTAAYSQMLDNIVRNSQGHYRRASLGTTEYTFQPDLQRTFNRGYTTYFANGRQPQMANFYTPKAIGREVARVKTVLPRQRAVIVDARVALANGDGLCFFDQQRQLQGFRVNRAEGDKLLLPALPPGIKPGMALFRSSDQAFDRILAARTAQRRIPLKMTLAVDGTTLRLTVDDTRRKATVELPAQLQTARTPQRENIVRELSKLGNTPFKAAEILLPEDFQLFIPASTLSALRRKAIDAIVSIAPINTISSIKTIASISSIEIIEPASPPSPLMLCRYCLRHEMGFCERRGGRKPTWRDPLFLRLADGRRFRLAFNCRQCEMSVFADK